MIRYRCLGRTIADFRPRLDPDTADRLLRGDAVDAEYSSLATVLSAAAAGRRPTRRPGQSTRLPGQSAALAAFRAAATMPATPEQPPSVMRSAMIKLLGVKAALFTALAVSGIALAAGATILSHPEASRMGAQPAASTPMPTDQTQTTTPTSPPASAVAPPQTSGSPSVHQSPRAPAATGSASPSLEKLCQVYIAIVSGSPQHDNDDVDIDISVGLDSPSFQVLIKAAGGRAAVGPFCIAVLHPTRPDHHDGWGWPPGHP